MADGDRGSGAFDTEVRRRREGRSRRTLGSCRGRRVPGGDLRSRLVQLRVRLTEAALVPVVYEGPITDRGVLAPAPRTLPSREGFGTSCASVVTRRASGVVRKWSQCRRERTGGAIRESRDLPLSPGPSWGSQVVSRTSGFRYSVHTRRGGAPQLRQE